MRSVKRPFVLTMCLTALLMGIGYQAGAVGLPGEFVMHKNNSGPERLNFANHLWNCNRGWRAVTEDGGSRRLSADEGELDELGYPRLAPGEQATTQVVVPDSGAKALVRGRMTVTWRGSALVEISGGAEVVERGNRRLDLDVTDTYEIVVTAGDKYRTRPLRHLRAWLPDPENRAQKSLAPAEGEREAVIHPAFVEYWAVPGISVWRVAWSQFNDNPQETWQHTRHPDHCFMVGSIPRKEVPGREPRTAERGKVSWQHCIALANALDVDMWVNIPHGAHDSYVRNLARLVLFGSDADGRPYDSPQANPVYPPLNPEHRIHVELSNEMWHPGFHQGVWAYLEHQRLGIPYGAVPGRRVSEMWSLFQEEFEKAGEDWTERLVRVAACSDNRIGWSREFVEEAIKHGQALPSLKPEQTMGGSDYKLATRPDVLAAANYFGNAIDQYAVEMSAPGSEHPFWDPGDAPLEAIFRQWQLRLMTGGRSTNWVNSTKGTLEVRFIEIAREHDLEIVGYEGGYGGPSLDRKVFAKYPEVKFVNRKDKKARSAPGVEGAPLTDHAMKVAKMADVEVPESVFRRFIRYRVMEADGMAHVMRLQLELLKSAGMRLPCNSSAFDNDAVQRDWGLAEYLPEPLAEAPRRRAVLEFVEDHKDLNEVGEVHGQGAPEFTTPESLLTYQGRRMDSVRIEAAGGDGDLRIEVFGRWIPEGIRFDEQSLTVSGTPATRELGYIFARVNDADGDLTYRLFHIETVDPALGTPIWRETFNDLPEGTTEDEGETAWHVTKTGDVTGTCEVRQGVLSAIGVKEEKANGEVIWHSEEIDISDHDSVNLFLRVTSNDEVDRGRDWLRISYIINGGEPVQIADFSGQNAEVKDPIVKALSLKGETLQIQARMTNMNIEMYGLDEVSLFVLQK